MTRQKAGKKTKRMMTRREWVKFYQSETGFEPTLDTNKKFAEFAHANMRWFEQWSQDVLNRITRFPKESPCPKQK